MKILTISILIFSCNQNETDKKPITTFADAIKYAKQNFKESTETLWIADALALDEQISMVIIDDKILEVNYIPDGFEQMYGYRIYKYKKATLKLSMDTFNVTSNEVDKCACYFSASKEDFKNKKYLFAAGFDGAGYISINNKLTKIKLDSTDRKADTCGDCSYCDYYSSGEYKVIITIRDRNTYGSGEVPNFYGGSIEIINREWNKISKWFTGECENPESFYQSNAFKMFTIIKQRMPKDWINVKQKDRLVAKGIYYGIDIVMDKKPEIHLNYVNDNVISFESHRVNDLRSYDDSIVFVTDNFHGDSIFNWTFRPINKNKGYWSVYKIQANKYENLGLFKAKKE